MDIKKKEMGFQLRWIFLVFGLLLLMTGCTESEGYFLNKESRLVYAFTAVDSLGKVKNCGDLEIKIEYINLRIN